MEFDAEGAVRDGMGLVVAIVGEEGNGLSSSSKFVQLNISVLAAKLYSTRT